VAVQSARTSLRPVPLAGWLAAPGLAFLAATEATRLGLVLCPFRLLTHVPCPGCGMTHAMLALCRGDLRAALIAHPLSPFLAAALGVWWVNGVLDALGRPRLVKLPAAAARLWWLALAVALALWIARVAGCLPAAY
jgi:hypothetical protein